MKASRKKRRTRVVPRVIFATVCLGVVPELASCCTFASVAASCFTTDGGDSCDEDALPKDAGGPDAGPRDAGPDAGHGDGGGDGG